MVIGIGLAVLAVWLHTPAMLGFGIAVTVGIAASAIKLLGRPATPASVGLAPK